MFDVCSNSPANHSSLGWTERFGAICLGGKWRFASSKCPELDWLTDIAYTNALRTVLTRSIRMVRSRLVTGGLPDAVLFNAVKAIRSLRENYVADLVPLLGDEPDPSRHLYALRLLMQAEPSTPHSGWLFARYLDACRDLRVDGSASVAIVVEDLFEEFAQFSIKVNPALFIGIGEHGKQILEAILEAERTFDPEMFDADGYAV